MKPTKFEPSQNTVTLTLSFRHEATRPEVQKIRGVLKSLEHVLNQLIDMQDFTSDGNPLSIKNKNTLIRPGKPNKECPGTCFPDTIALKLYPEDVVFKTPDDEVLALDNIDFREYDVQPVVELRDVFKIHDKFYPRLVVKSCVLHPHAVGTLTMLPAASMDWEDCVFEPAQASDEEKSSVDSTATVPDV